MGEATRTLKSAGTGRTATPRRGDLLEPFLDVVDDGQRVGAGTLQDDAARHLAFTVQLSNTAPLRVPFLILPIDISETVDLFVP